MTDPQQLLREKLKELQRAYAIENDTATKFKLQHQIDQATRDLDTLDTPGEHAPPERRADERIQQKSPGTRSPHIVAHGDVNIHMSDTREIHTGRDYIENIDGQSTVITGASDHARQQVNLQQLAESIHALSSPADVATLLETIRQQLTSLKLPETTREEVETEVKAAAIQVKKETPDKPRIAGYLKNAAAALKNAGTLGAEAIALGNAIGKAILWCGEQWIAWGI